MSPVSAPEAAATRSVAARPRAGRSHDVLAVARVEMWKLSAQARVRIAGVVCLVGPFLFGALVRATGTVPADTVFGRQVSDSGSALPLVVLGFAGSWAIPLLVSVVAGDVVSSEDHHGTWSVVLTRSRTRRSVLVGKVVAAAAYAVVAVCVLAAASVLAGLVFGAGHDLIGLSGTTFGHGRATALVVAAWASVLPAALAFGAVGLVVSVATRNSLAGIVAPAALGLLGQLLTLVDGAGPVVAALPTGSFLAWHGLFAEPRWTAALWRGALVSAVWCAVFVLAAVVAFRRRLRRGI